MLKPPTPRVSPWGQAMDWLYGKLLIPAFETGLKRRRTFGYWQELERSQWLEPAEIESMQFEALRRLLRHAYDTSPYYRETWSARGLHPDALASLDDLTRWPILTKDDLRTRRRDIRSRAEGLRFYSKSTSGSSGEPAMLDYDQGSLERRMAAWFRGYAWAGAAPGVKQFYFWGTTPHPRSRLACWKEEWHHRLYRRVSENCLAFRDRDAAAVLGRYERARPAVVVAYTRPLYEFCRVLAERGLRPTPPRSIIVGAEKLYDFQRALIEEMFQAPVFETYGCREVMLIAAECEQHAGLHLASEHLVVEIVDDDGRPVPAGQEGRVIATDLYNYGAPFVRYEMGDRAVARAGRCACGRGLPLLDRVLGRTLEIVLTPDGRRIPGETFPFLLDEYGGIGRYQVVQVAESRLVVRIEPRADWSPELGTVVRESVERLAGSRMTVELEVVESLPGGPSGKFQVVRNPWLEAKRAEEHRHP